MQTDAEKPEPCGRRLEPLVGRRLRIGDWYFVRWRKSSTVEIGQCDLGPAASALRGTLCLLVGGVVLPVDKMAESVDLLGRCPSWTQLCELYELAVRMSNSGVADRCKAGNQVLDILER